MKKSITKVFSLTDHFEGKVKRLQLTIQDVPIYKSPEDQETLIGNSSTIFGTLQLYKDNDKKNVANVNFTLPLTFNADLKNHILSMVGEAIKLKEKSKK